MRARDGASDVAQHLSASMVLSGAAPCPRVHLPVRTALRCALRAQQSALPVTSFLRYRILRGAAQSKKHSPCFDRDVTLVSGRAAAYASPRDIPFHIVMECDGAPCNRIDPVVHERVWVSRAALAAHASRADQAVVARAVPRWLRFRTPTCQALHAAAIACE